MASAGGKSAVSGAAAAAAALRNAAQKAAATTGGGSVGGPSSPSSPVLRPFREIPGPPSYPVNFYSHVLKIAEKKKRISIFLTKILQC